jgi:hypothetical protein
MFRDFCVAEQPAASQEGLSSMELVIAYAILFAEAEIESSGELYDACDLVTTL